METENPEEHQGTGGKEVPREVMLHLNIKAHQEAPGKNLSKEHARDQELDGEGKVPAKIKKCLRENE